MDERAALAVNALDAWFLEADPLDVVIASPGPPNVVQAAACFRAALNHMPHYASRVARSGQELAVVFDPTAPEFHERAQLELGWQEIADHHIQLLAAPVRSRPGSHTSALAITPLKDGFTVCLSGSHVVGDARSFVTFARTWYCLYRGVSPPAVSDQRAFRLDARDLAQIAPRVVERLPARSDQGVAQSVEQETVRLSTDALQRMLPEVGGSMHQAATALLLRMFRDRLFATERAARLRVPADIRGVLPGLSDGYIGNAFLDAFVEITRDDVDAAPARIANLQRDAIARLKRPDEVARLLHLGPRGLEPTAEWAEHQPAFDARRDVALGSLVGRVAPTGVEVNLGHGRVRLLPRTPAPRGFLILPDRTDGLMVQVRLQPARDLAPAPSAVA